MTPVLLKYTDTQERLTKKQTQNSRVHIDDQIHWARG